MRLPKYVFFYLPGERRGHGGKISDRHVGAANLRFPPGGMASGVRTAPEVKKAMDMEHTKNSRTIQHITDGSYFLSVINTVVEV